MTINLDCMDQDDADEIGLDRKDWANGSTTNHSEGYLVNFDLPPASDFGPCMKITELEIEVTVNSFDFSGVPTGCGISDTWLNLYASNSLDTDPASVDENFLLTPGTGSASAPDGHSGTYNFICSPSDNIPFGGQVGVDMVPVSNIGGCSESQSLISNGFITIEFDFCVTIVVDVSGVADVDASADETTICLGEDIELSENEADSDFWEWTGPNGFTSTDDNPVVVNTTSADIGTYNVVVTDVNGCTASQDVEIMMHPLSTANATADEIAVCPGQDIILNEDGGDAVSWDWTGPDGFSENDQDPTITSSTADNLGLYTVEITDSNGCTATSDITITALTPPGANASSPDDTVCPGQAIDLNEDGGDAISWMWSGPNGFTSTDQSPNIPVSTSDDIGNYVVTITSNNGCSNTSDIEIFQEDLPDAFAEALAEEVCPGQPIELDETDGIAIAWLWSGPNGYNSNVKDPIISNSTINDLGTYTVTVTDINNCTNTSEIEIVSGPAPAISAFSPNPLICPGQDIILDEDGGDADQWQWTGPNGFNGNTNDPTISNATTINLGTYMVTVTDTEGCTSTDEVEIQGETVPNSNAEAISTAICPGDDISLTENGGQAVSWSWTGPNGFTSIDQSPIILSSTTADIGTYIVEVTNNGGCIGSSSIDIVAGNCACSLTELMLGNIICNDSGSLSDNTDDFIAFDLNPQVTNGGTGYTVTISAGTITPMVGTYGVTTNFQMNPGSAGAGIVIVTIVDNQDATCSLSIPVTDPGSCSTECAINSMVLNAISCNENSTPSDDSDDFISFSLNPQVSNGGAGYTVTVNSGTVSPILGIYGVSTTFQLQDGSAGAGDIIITIVDNTNQTCTSVEPLVDPGTCSGACNITQANLADIICVDNQTPFDETDDFISFVINPTSTNTSANYTLTLSQGSINSNTGTFGVTTGFQLQAGSAGQGPVTITLTDENDPTCNFMFTVTDPGICSTAKDCPTLSLDIGEACDDGDPLTMNDMVLPDCSCAGSLSFDCPALSLNIGDNCDDSDPLTMNDIIQSDCSCAGSLTFDCPVEQVNIGDVCDDGNFNTNFDVIQSDCTCAGVFDCPILMLNIGDSCDDNDPLTMNDTVQNDCSCAGNLTFDCPTELVNFGDSCDDGNANTIDDVIQLDCSCAGVFDCPAIMLNFGAPCDDADPLTMNDRIQQDCSCAGSTSFDCPIEQVNFGDTCNDGNPDTANDIIQADCTCAGVFDCPTLMQNIGDACDDNDANTMNDTIQNDCTCVGSTTFDCPTEMVNFGDICNDGNPDTADDIIQSDCTCLGVFDCPILMLNIGDSCDDGNVDTDNDLVQGDCSCIGITTFDCPTEMINFGDTCDDGNPDTIDDTVQADCSCLGTPDCNNNSTIAPTVLPCDDGIECTINDVETVLSDGTVCEPCLGEFQDCENGLTFVRICDDNNPSTFDDVETVLECDNSVCVPCLGTLETTEIYFPNAFAPQLAGDDRFGLFSDAAVLISQMSIYDRWGNIVHRVENIMSDEADAKWDGRHNSGKLVEQGVYIYVISYQVNGVDKINVSDITVYY